MCKHREVVQSARYDNQLAAIESDARTADQTTHAVAWALARQPERGFGIPGTPWSIWPVYIRGEEYVVYYTFDDYRVELVAVIPSTAEL